MLARTITTWFNWSDVWCCLSINIPEVPRYFSTSVHCRHYWDKYFDTGRTFWNVKCSVWYFSEANTQYKVSKKGNKYKVYPVYILDTGNNFSLFSRRQNYVKYVGVLKERANEAAECRLQPRHAWVDGNFTAIFGLGNCQPFNSVNFIISEHFILIDVSEMPRQNNLLFTFIF